ncbi:fimbrial protein [Erwinia tasmaniensis]|nr:fimbrial protein [Erwinia tasmaniensis]
MTQKHYRVVSLSLLIISAAIFFVPQALATLSGKGIVNMEGAIMDSACAIAAESRDQTIDMDTVPVGNIVREGYGPAKSFSLKLIHCELDKSHPKSPQWRNFQVMFDGEVDGNLFGINGEAAGIALEIKDTLGNIAKPGEAMPLREIIPGSLKLDYMLRLVSNNKVLKPGPFNSSVRFKMDYY